MRVDDIEFYQRIKLFGLNVLRDAWPDIRSRHDDMDLEDLANYPPWLFDILDTYLSEDSVEKRRLDIAKQGGLLDKPLSREFVDYANRQHYAAITLVINEAFQFQCSMRLLPAPSSPAAKHARSGLRLIQGGKRDKRDFAL